MVRLWDWYQATQGTAMPPNPRHTITYSTPTPDEKPVSSNNPYNVPADQPKKIIIPSVGIEGFIERVGIDQYNEIGVPSNVHLAGWFVDSNKPGLEGLSIVVGHVSARYGTALFAGINKLAGGAEVIIQFGDDSTRTFSVVDKRELPKARAADYLLKKRDEIGRQLNLVTCGGGFNKSSQQYNNRVVVVTKTIK